MENVWFDTNWLDEENARYYDLHERNFDGGFEARKLLTLADLRPGMTVLDVGCGTGQATALALKQLEGTGNVIGVDISEAMVRRAQQNCPEAHFLTTPTEHVHELLPPASVDVVLSNSAFGMMSYTEALYAIYQVLKPGGRFVFNLPDFFFAPFSLETMPLLSLMHEVAREDHHGYASGFSSQVPLDDPAMQVLLKEAGFTCLGQEDGHVCERNADEVYDSCKIPIMTSWLFPNLSYEQRMLLLDKAYARYDKSSKEANTWRYYIAQK